MAMDTRRWINQSQPQTLVIAVFLLYFDAVFTALFGGLFSPLGLVLIVGSVAAGFGIANERKWGYYLGIAIAVFFLLPFALSLLQNGTVGNNIIGLAFAIAKFALLVHPQSRQYEKIWFK
jgi:hypothetical protein